MPSFQRFTRRVCHLIPILKDATLWREKAAVFGQFCGQNLPMSLDFQGIRHVFPSAARWALAHGYLSGGRCETLGGPGAKQHRTAQRLGWKWWGFEPKNGRGLVGIEWGYNEDISAFVPSFFAVELSDSRVFHCKIECHIFYWQVNFIQATLAVIV